MVDLRGSSASYEIHHYDALNAKPPSAREFAIPTFITQAVFSKSQFIMGESKMALAAMYQLPLTPTSPLSSATMSDAGGPIEEISSKDALATALHVIRTERHALTQLESLYESDVIAQEGLANSVNAITTSICSGGKLVIIGVGKSGKIGQKVVATMNSFGIRSAFLHPTEALHGDLGMIGEVSILAVFRDARS